MNLRLSEDRRIKSRITIACVVVCGLMLGAAGQRIVQYSKPGDSATPTDFPGYYVVAVVARTDHGRHIYDISARTRSTNGALRPVQGDELTRAAKETGAGKIMELTVPPFMATLLWPFAFLSLNSALTLWRVVSVALLLLSLFFVVRLTNATPWVLYFAIAAAGAFAYFPVIETVFQGQFGILVLFLWSAGAYALERKRETSSAFCFALATMIKLFPILIVGLFVVHRRWNWLIKFSVWMLAFTMVGIFQFGWQTSIDYVTHVLPPLSCGTPFFANRSLIGIVLDIYNGRLPMDIANASEIPRLLCAAIKAFSLALYLGVLAWFWRRRRGKEVTIFEMAEMVLVLLVISPTVWRHYYVLALMPFVLTWIAAIRNPDSVKTNQLIALTASSLVTGTVFIEYAIDSLRWPTAQILLASAWPISLMVLSVFALSDEKRAYSHVSSAQQVPS